LSLKSIIQKILSTAGFRLVRLPSEPHLSLDIVDQVRQMDRHDFSKFRPLGDLESWFRQGGGVNVHKWLHYFEIYERHFAPFRGKPVKVLEIGVYKGGSLRMWQAYFGSNSTIVGLDINPTCKKFEKTADNIHVRIGDQESQSFLTSVQKEFGLFDIVIDDGGHTTGQQIQSFIQLYFFSMKPEGIYLVEDLHTNYWKRYMTYPGGLTFVELAAKLVHRLHDAHQGHDEDFIRFDVGNSDRFETLEVGAFCAQTRSIHFYDSIIVFERGCKTMPYHEER
jgi:hypothetical protein